MRWILIIIIFAAAAGITFMVIRNNTTPEHIGVSADGRLAEVPSTPNAVSSQADGDKAIEGLPLKEDPDSWDLLHQLLERQDDADIITADRDYMHAVFRSPTMKFKDDVEFYRNEEKGVIDVRSAARIGYSDMNANRNRVERLREGLAGMISGAGMSN
ncbi:DUF1499 domain-containing protein [Alkalicoccus chagannorensis]|uniref:DUF1499 domain-containing protein n=1 Tax=Alkalicoccus chagannorensis TaxID=427072 RepID=UPI0004094585|nr:DUF1499 domain-containing protein [Alkalicoccus chagannorensis]